MSRRKHPLTAAFVTLATGGLLAACSPSTPSEVLDASGDQPDAYVDPFPLSHADSGAPGSVCTCTEDCGRGTFCGYERGCDAPVGHCVANGGGDAIAALLCGCDNVTQIASPGSPGERPWRYNGRCLQFSPVPMSTATTANLRDAAITMRGDWYVVGDGGVILTQTAGTWAPVASGVTFDLRAVVVSSDTAWIAGGDGSTVLEGHGSSWFAHTGLTGGPLYAAGVLGGVVWVAGGATEPAGSVAHAFPSGRTLDMSAGAHPIVAILDDRAVDGTGAAYRFNGTTLVADGTVATGAPVDATAGVSLSGRAALGTLPEELTALTAAAAGARWVLRDVAQVGLIGQDGSARLWVGDDGMIIAHVPTTEPGGQWIVQQRGHATLRRIASRDAFETLIIGDQGTLLQRQ